MFPKDNFARDKKYLNFIDSLPCAICGDRSTHHHTEGGGMSIKGSDYSCIPLCGSHHTPDKYSIHWFGSNKLFAEHWGLDIEEIIKRCKKAYELKGGKIK